MPFILYSSPSVGACSPPADTTTLRAKCKSERAACKVRLRTSSRNKCMFRGHIQLFFFFFSISPNIFLKCKYRKRKKQKTIPSMTYHRMIPTVKTFPSPREAEPHDSSGQTQEGLSPPASQHRMGRTPHSTTAALYRELPLS